MTSTYKLDNGLTVVLQENHISPVVAFQAWVGVGSADEPEELAGVAHVFEHMLFKGTARRGVGQIAQEIESAGGDINAWTSFDETVYHVVLASRFFDAGLDIVTDALRNSSFDPGELARELKVVLEEVKQGEDSPSRVAAQSLFNTVYTRHPYRRPVIGYTRTVEKFTRAQLLTFFRKHYVPNNITLVVVGDFDTAKARKQIAALWGDARPVPLPPRADRGAVEPPQRAPRSVAVASDVREIHLGVAFHIPGLVHPDTGALDVGAILLGQGDSSRLNRQVKRNRQVVSDVYAYSYTPRDPGLLVAGATLPPDKLDAALDAIIDELLRMLRDDVTDDEINKAKTIVESDAVYQKETVQGMARKLGFFQNISGGLDYEEAYNRQVREVTPRQLREVLSRYVRIENCTVSLLGPTALLEAAGGKKRLEAHLVERARAAFERAGLGEAGTGNGARQPVAGKATPETVKRAVLSTGTRVLVLRDASVPVVAMRAVWTGGLLAEDERTNGINNLLAALMTRGTRTRTGDELSHEVESMAGAIGGFSGRNSFGLRGEVMARHWERGLDILLDCLLHPRFPEEELEKERRQVLEELRTQEDSISSVAFRLFGQTIYPHHPYRLDMLGTPESVAALTRRKLVDFYNRRFPLSEMTIAVVGDVDPPVVIERLRRSLEAEGTGKKASAPSAMATTAATATVAQLPLPKGGAAITLTAGPPRQALRYLNKQQAHIVVGYPGTTIRDPDRYALELLATVLSGQGGRLFVELRDKRGLAYRISAFSLEGMDPGYFAVYMATSPANLEVARAGIQEELDKVLDKPIPKAELERAQRYLVGAHDISLQRRSALASTLAFNEAYGLGWDEYQRYAAGILGVTSAEVRRVARKYLDPQRAVIAVVRPDADVQPQAAPRRSRTEAAKAVRVIKDRSPADRTAGGADRSQSKDPAPKKSKRPRR